MPRTSLEAELAALTEEFVARIVGTLRNASFADVAALAPTPSRARVDIPRPTRAAPAASAKSSSKRTRTGPTERAALLERLVDTLRDARSPLGMRALSDALGVAADKLTGPLKDLRDAGRVEKHGDKRATTYSAT